MTYIITEEEIRAKKRYSTKSMYDMVRQAP